MVDKNGMSIAEKVIAKLAGGGAAMSSGTAPAATISPDINAIPEDQT